MDEPFVEMLRGATNTLGRTDEVAAIALDDHSRAREVYDLFFQDDEWVRLRAASVSKRLWRANPDLFAPFVAGWVEYVSAIDQPSSQWTFAQMCEECDDLLTDDQRDRSIEIVSGYLAEEDDWIVLNSSMSALAQWAQTRPELAATITPHLQRRAKDGRKSVAGRANKALNRLPQSPD